MKAWVWSSRSIPFSCRIPRWIEIYWSKNWTNFELRSGLKKGPPMSPKGTWMVHKLDRGWSQSGTTLIKKKVKGEKKEKS